MVLFALSFQGQVEKYGVYVGIAAFFGLAVLSLLYFSQARELKRLREWAGRAPERARELEQRVVAQAAANVARRAPSMPGAPRTQGTIAPPRRLAEMPVPPPGAQTAAGAQATELAEAVEADEPATNGNVPAPPAAGAGMAGAANGAAPPAEDADQASGDGAAAGNERAEAAQEGAADEAAAAAAATGDEATGAGAEKSSEEVEAESGEQPSDEVAAEPSEEPELEPRLEPEPQGEAERTVAAETGEEPEPEPQREPEPQPEAERTVAARPGEVPAAVPRATPAQRVGVTPRPAPLPLRQTRPSATPAAGRGGKRPAAPAARRPAGAPREGRSAGTVALFVGLAVLVLGGGAFAVSQFGGDDTPPAPNRAAPPPNQTETGGTGGSGTGEPAKTPAETNVAVLNGTTFTGLAGQLADRVSQEGGYERGATETNTRDQTIQTSTVYYADGFRSQARKVAELLSISAVEPVDEDTQALAPDADVVVLAGADQAP
jgi:hypothetical protein